MIRHYVSLGLFLLLVLGGGLLIGFLTAPGPWYQALKKPSFNPPAWVFGPAWTVLYILIAIAGWRLWQTAQGSVAMSLWWAQLLLNFAWSPAFFSLHLPGAALIVILSLLAVIIACIFASLSVDRGAALLMVPYLGWVGFATILNAAIWRLNG